MTRPGAPGGAGPVAGTSRPGSHVEVIGRQAGEEALGQFEQQDIGTHALDIGPIEVRRPYEVHLGEALGEQPGEQHGREMRVGIAEEHHAPRIGGGVVVAIDHVRADMQLILAPSAS